MLIRIIILLLLVNCGGGGGSSIVTNHDMIPLEAAEFETAEYKSETSDDNIYQNFLGQINASKAYAYLANQGKSYAGDDVKVAVVDSGVNKDHSDLNANYSNQSEASSGTDDNGHGTHVAGIIAATKNDIGMHGVAYKAKIVSAAILNEVSDNLVKSTIINSGATVVNNSWGYASDTNYTAYNADLKEMIDNNDKRVIIFAAGNDGYSYATSPADQSDKSEMNGQMLTVMALNKDNIKAYYSNGCRDMKYCLAAPGGDLSNDSGTIYSTEGNNYKGMQGTSMAAPVVSGAAAVLQGAWNNLTAANLVDILLETADITSENYKALNLYRAVQNQGISSTSIAGFNNKFLYDTTKLTIPNKLSGLNKHKNLAALLKKGVFFDKYNRDYKAKYNQKIDFYGYENSGFYNFFTNSNLVTKNTNFNSTSLNFSVTSSQQKKTIGEEISFTGQEKSPINNSLDYLSYKFKHKAASFAISKNVPIKTMITDSKFAKVNFITSNNLKNFYQQVANFDSYNFNSNFKLASNINFASNLIQANNKNTNKNLYGISNNLQHQLKKFTLNYNFAFYKEEESLAGMSGNQAFNIANYSNSNNFAVSFLSNFKSKWNYLLNINWLKLNPKYNDNFINGSKNFNSINYALGTIYQKDKFNQLGLIFSQPAMINKGNLTFTLPTSIDSNNIIITDSMTVNFADYKEYNAELFWQKGFSAQNNLQINLIHKFFDYSHDYANQDNITELYLKYVKNF